MAGSLPPKILPSDDTLPLYNPKEPYYNVALHNSDPQNERLFSIIADYLQPKNEFSIDMMFSAAECIADMLPDSGEEDCAQELEAEAEPLGYFFVGLASQIPYYHPSQDRLVHLFLTLGTTNKLLVENRGFDWDRPESQIPDNWWTETIFLHQWREFYWEFHSCLDIGLKGSVPEEEVNRHAFFARLMSAGFFGTRVDPFMYKYRDHMENGRGFNPVLDANRVSCLAMWMIYCGQHLFNRVVLNAYTQEAISENSYKPGRYYEGTDMGLGRWRFWRQRFASVEAKDPHSDFEAANLAMRASKLMLAFEENMMFEPLQPLAGKS